MKRIVFIVAFLAGAIVPAQAIVGATPSKDPDGVRRHTVAIMFERGLCTGVLIARDMIVTAAHCFVGNTPRVVVALDPQFRPRFLKIRTAASHPSFQHAKTPVQSAGIDLAVVQLAQPAPDDMAPAGIGGFDERGDVFIAGFGIGHARDSKAGVLRGAFLRARAVDWKSHRLIAAIGTDGQNAKIGTGGCRGDSGGPLYAQDTGAVVGIVSWSSGTPGKKNSCGGLTVATALGDHQAWVSQTVAGLRRSGSGQMQAPSFLPNIFGRGSAGAPPPAWRE
ncbi:MAG: S1 family peptidase [Beijerinckiaceae bacterium]